MKTCYRYFFRPVLFVTLTFVFAYSTVIKAQTIAGSDDPRIHSAIDAWLENNESESLPVLAGLAREGNTASRILFSRMENTDRIPSPYTDGMDRSSRLALFRIKPEEGPFYQSWLKLEADGGNELAQLLIKAGGSYPDIESLQQLRDAGEIHATEHLVKAAALYSNNETKAKLLDQKLTIPELIPFIKSHIPPELKYGDGVQALSYVAGKPVTTIDTSNPDTRDAALFMSLGIPYGYLESDNSWRGAIESWLSTASITRPVRDFCAASCPGEITECGIMITGMSGGYYEVIRAYSPLESLIPQDRFLESKRAQNLVFRRAALNIAEYDDELISITDIAKRSPCLAGLVEQERAGSAYYQSR